MITNTVDFFFYGTLLDPEVRAVVFGRAATTGTIQPGIIAGVRRAPVRNKTYPMLVPEPGGQVDGLFVPGVDLNAAARTSYFEGEGYAPQGTEVALDSGGTATAWIYVPLDMVRAAPGEWRFDRWRQRHINDYIRESNIWMRGCSGREQTQFRDDWQRRLRGT